MSNASGSLVMQWAVAVDAFNRDDLEPLADLMAERCEFTSSGNRIGSTRDEIVALLKQARADGWVRHVPLSLSEGGGFLVSVYRNEFADGSSFVGAGIVRVDDWGLICELLALEPPEVRPNA